MTENSVLAAAAAEAQELPEDKLERLTVLANRQMEFDGTISDLEEQLDQAKKARRQISEDMIPALMDEIGISEFKLRDGTKVTVAPYYNGQAKTPEQFTWLEQHGHDGIIKNEVVIDLGKGVSPLERDQLVGQIEELGWTPAVKKGVHHMTMRGFIREQVEGDDPFPLDLFNAYVGRQTKIK